MTPTRRPPVRLGLLTMTGATLVGLSALVGSPASAASAPPAHPHAASVAALVGLRLPAAAPTTTSTRPEPRQMKGGCGVSMESGETTDL